MSYFNKPIYNYSFGTAASVTTAWKTVLMSSSTTAGTDIRMIEVFNGGGEVLELGTGASTGAATTLFYYIAPGGNPVPKEILINSGMRLFVRSPLVDTTAGTVFFNFFG